MQNLNLLTEIHENVSINPLTLGSEILLCLMPEDFSRQWGWSMVVQLSMG